MIHKLADCNTALVIGVTPQGLLHVAIFIGDTDKGNEELYEYWEFLPTEIRLVISDIKNEAKKTQHPALQDVYSAAIKALKDPDVTDMIVAVSDGLRQHRKNWN